MCTSGGGAFDLLAATRRGLRYIHSPLERRRRRKTARRYHVHALDAYIYLYVYTCIVYAKKKLRKSFSERQWESIGPAAAAAAAFLALAGFLSPLLLLLLLPFRSTSGAGRVREENPWESARARHFGKRILPAYSHKMNGLSLLPPRVILSDATMFTHAVRNIVTDFFRFFFLSIEACA